VYISHKEEASCIDYIQARGGVGMYAYTLTYMYACNNKRPPMEEAACIDYIEARGGVGMYAYILTYTYAYAYIHTLYV
jgi:hypothetical protein